jgi:hypothetical protein
MNKSLVLVLLLVLELTGCATRAVGERARLLSDAEAPAHRDWVYRVSGDEAFINMMLNNTVPHR